MVVHCHVPYKLGGTSIVGYNGDMALSSSPPAARRPVWLRLADRLWPDLSHGVDAATATDRAGLVLLTLLVAPLAAGGVIWLVSASFPLPPVQVELWLLLLALHQVLALFDFSALLQTEDVHVPGALARLITWSGALLLGPAALWLDGIGVALAVARRWRRSAGNAEQRWRLRGRLALNLARDTLPGLAALAAYRAWGGAIPLSGLTWVALRPALYATLLYLGLTLLILLPLFLFRLATRAYGGRFSLLVQVGRLVRATTLLYLLPPICGALLAGLYTQLGLGIYLPLVGGIFLVALFAHQLGILTLRAQQRALENRGLEALTRALLAEPPHAPDLEATLARHAPAIFHPAHVEVRLFPDHNLHTPPIGPLVDETWWGQVQQLTTGSLVARDVPASNNRANLALVPILAAEGGHILGGIALAAPLGAGYITDWLPPLQTMAASIALALHRAEAHQVLLDSLTKAYREEVYAQLYQTEIALTYQRLAQESALAGRIQTSFLPRHVPTLPGWQISVTLEPARETSGDFYDFIPLPDGRVGLLVADVADKGMGAALFMALSRTLIRTYAAVYDNDPAQTLAAANDRILADTDSDLFVTVFYAILDPVSGRLTYANAGHNPPFCLGPRRNPHPLRLAATGFPLGILPRATWQQVTIQLEPGDVLALYTDGVTEAQDELHELFGEERLVHVLQSVSAKSAVFIDDKIFAAVYDFVGQAPQVDDITLMIVLREREPFQPPATVLET